MKVSLLNKIKNRIESKIIESLYNCQFQRHAKISINHKKIIFKPLMGFAMFRAFGSKKEFIMICLLIKWFKYGVFEEQLTWCSLSKSQDIIKDKPKVEVRVEEPILN